MAAIPELAPRPLEDRVILIVGGSSGLGLSAARRVVTAGGRVVLTGRDEAKLSKVVESLGDRAAGLAGDAGDPASAAAAVGECIDRFGRLDGLYHVAGGSGRRRGDGALHEVTDEGVDYTLRLNLESIIYSNRAAVRQFLAQSSASQGTERKGGVILNMGSVLGYSPSPEHFASHVYAAAKSAILGFTRSIAAYYAKDDIRANVIAPALVETPMAGRAVGDPAIREFIARKQPLDGGRIGRPEDLDEAVVFFLSDASRYVTGQLLAVDGGWSVSEGRG